MQKLLSWLDQHILTLLAGFLIIFIPLYPKWPLFDVLYGYNVRVRLEDFLILAANIVLLVQLIRKKIKVSKAPLFKPIAIYLSIGFVSTLSALFITRTIFPEYLQIAKLYFHWVRRIEYFSLFFIFFFALKSVKQIYLFLSLSTLTIFSVSIYGFGQKYLYWPAYSTMNREFSKGIALYLTEHARVLSTFGGHFDLAAYIVITLVPLIILAFLIKSKLAQVGLLTLALLEYWLLILTASRTSWIAFMIAISFAFLLLFKKKKFFWTFIRWLGVFSISVLIMFTIGDMSERFSHIFKLEGVKSFITSPFKAPPAGGQFYDETKSFEDQLSIVATKSDIPPSTKKTTATQRPADVYDNTYDNLNRYLASIGGETLNISYSENALKYGLSAGIRLDVLWPNALKALKTNPLLGTGYSSLTKTNVWDFTTAESTDNDYLRMLGETGILGTIAFLFIFFIILKTLWQAFKVAKTPLHYGLFASGIAITVGMLANAIYIDVFESSKIAYSYWSIIGLLLALAVYELKKA